MYDKDYNKFADQIRIPTTEIIPLTTGTYYVYCSVVMKNTNPYDIVD